MICDVMTDWSREIEGISEGMGYGVETDTLENIEMEQKNRKSNE